MDDIEKIRAEKAQKKLEDLKSKRKKDFWSPKPGKNSIRILPNWNGDPEGEFFRETAYHRKLGTERDKSVVCLLREGHERCPVCELAKSLFRTKNSEDKEVAKEIKAQTRILYNIIDLGDVGRGVQVWMSGVDALEQILGYCANIKYGHMPDPETGRNIDLVLTEGKNSKSGFNEYIVQPDPDRSAIQEPEWLLQMVDLDSLVKTSSLEEVQALIGDQSSDVAPEKAAPVAEKVAEKGPVKLPCFGKFSSDDAECQKCSDGNPCKEVRSTRTAKSESPEKPKAEVEKPKVEKAETEKPKAKKSDIKDVLAKLREEKAKK